MQLIPPNTKIDFMGKRRYAYMFTAVVILLSVLSYPIKGGIQLGIDFTGGLMIQVQFKNPVDTEHIRQALEPVSPNMTVQKFSLAGEDYILRMEAPEEGAEVFSRKILELLETKFGKGSVEIRGLEMVGPKVGKDLQESAIWATIIALGLLLAYMSVRFTLSMGLGAIFCLIHDIIAVYGFFVWTGKEFNLTILAAMLTIIGYDINDTIVVCDRVRDNLKTTKKRPLVEVLNDSINQTLSRTILTSLFTMLVVFALLIVGTNVLRDFAWALLVGLIFGTYSTIFVASPVILAIDKYIPVKRG